MAWRSPIRMTPTGPGAGRNRFRRRRCHRSRQRRLQPRSARSARCGGSRAAHPTQFWRRPDNRPRRIRAGRRQCRRGQEAAAAHDLPARSPSAEVQRQRDLRLPAGICAEFRRDRGAGRPYRENTAGDSAAGPAAVVPPGFRGEEEPPVLEASGGSGYAFTGDEPRVLEAPLAVALRRPAGRPRAGWRRRRRQPAPTPPGFRPQVGSRADAGVASPMPAGTRWRRAARAAARHAAPLGLRRPGWATSTTCAPRQPPTSPSSHCRALWG